MASTWEQATQPPAHRPRSVSMWDSTNPAGWTRLLTIVSIVSEPRLVPADEISVGFAPVVLKNVFSAYPETGS
jgi:hypothetical protein